MQRESIEKGNVAAGIIGAAIIIGVCIIVAAAIVGNGLGDYYRHRDALPASQREALPQALIDLGLPDGSGLELLGKLRQASIQLPAIALSGYGQERDIQQSRAAGFLTHLTKPVDLDVLERTLREVAEQHLPKPK